MVSRYTRKNRKYSRKSRRSVGGGKPGAGQGKKVNKGPSQKNLFAAKAAAKAAEAAQVAAVAEAVASVEKAAAEAAALAAGSGAAAKGQKTAAAEAAHKVLGELTRSGANEHILKAAEAAAKSAIDSAERGTLSGREFVAMQRAQVEKTLKAQERAKGVSEANRRMEGWAGAVDDEFAARAAKLSLGGPK
jgi:hypothetical protein